MADDYEINCLFSYKTFSAHCVVTISRNKRVANLVVALRAELPHYMQFNVLDLSLWKPNTPLGLDGSGFDEANAQELNYLSRLSAYWPALSDLPEEVIHVVLKVNSDAEAVSERLLDDPIVLEETSPGDEVLRNYRDIIIQIAMPISFDLQANDIHMYPTSQDQPDFVSDMWNKLTGKLKLDVAFTNEQLEVFIGSQFAAKLESAEGTASTSAIMNSYILSHLNLVRLCSRQFWHDIGKTSEKDVWGIFLYHLTPYLREIRAVSCLFRQSLPMPMLVHTTETTGGKKYKKWTPMSDFAVILNGFPRLVLEIRSKDNREDYRRMMLYGASIVRLANYVLKDKGRDKTFALMAIYIINRVAECFLLYEKGKSRKIFYAQKNYHLDWDNERFDFTCVLYNFAQILKADDGTLSGHTPEIGELKTAIEKHAKGTLYGTVYGNKFSKRTCPDESSEYAHSSGGTDDRDEDEEFALDGYELVNDTIRFGRDVFEPLYQLPPHIHKMRRKKDRKDVMVKEIRRDKGHNELEILEFLRTIQPPCKHIISLLDTADSCSGKCIVLHLGHSLDEQLFSYANGGHLQGKFLQLSRHLLEGLSFLHENLIAHLDIKPSNLVYTPDFDLQIIDFDIAVRLKSADEKIDVFCGSKDWMAPEIGEENGPRRLYSPTLADKWSCGRVLLEFCKRLRRGEDDKGLSDFAKQLMDDDPEKRPSLLEWRGSLKRKEGCVPSAPPSSPKRSKVEGDEDSLDLDAAHTTSFRKPGADRTSR